MRRIAARCGVLIARALLLALLVFLPVTVATQTAPAQADPAGPAPAQAPAEETPPEAAAAEQATVAEPAPETPSADASDGADPVAEAAVEPDAPVAAPAASPAARKLIRDTLADDIAGAGYDELRAEARRLGLDDGGSRRELQARLRRFFALTEATQPPSQPAQMVDVRQAAHAEYRSDAAAGGSYLVLRGDVELVVHDTEADTEHVIRADEVVYQHDAELLSARGGVEYVVSHGDGEPQLVGAASLAFDLATSKAVFVNGFTRQQRDGGAGPVTFTFAGDTITRLADATIILDGARFTSSPDPGLPNYEVRAQRMWLLAPGEWGLQGATLSVGGVPVLYLPFFFLPGDEMVFRPALGVRDREGLFVNTTLYLIGRRPPEDEPLSVLSLTTPGQYREELHGLFLRRVPTDTPPPDEHYLKLMLDLYARLGLFAGVAGDLPLAESGALEFLLGVARSRSIWPVGGSLIATDLGSGRSYWHDSSLFGVTLPLRYGLELAGNLALPEASLTGRLELFSDPDFVTDFGNREERFNWPALIGFKAATEEEPTRRSNLSWDLNARADFSRLMAADRGAPRLVDQLRLRNAGVRWLWHSRDRRRGRRVRGCPLRSDAHVLLSLLPAPAAVRADGRHVVAAAGKPCRRRPGGPARPAGRRVAPAFGRRTGGARYAGRAPAGHARHDAGVRRTAGPAAEFRAVPTAAGSDGAAALRSASRSHLRGHPRQRRLDHGARRGPCAAVGHRAGGPYHAPAA